MTTNTPPPAPLAAAPPPAKTSFDWAIYADATFAGLSLLIPIPFLDSVFERFFENNMAPAIAFRAGRVLSPEVRAALQGDENWLSGCLLLPITLLWSLIKRVSKKVLYFLTIKEATDKLSYYWHRAFLLDYMLEAGHLDQPATAQIARQALAHTLNSAGISPLTQLARQVAASPTHIWRSLRRVRKGQADAELTQERNRMAQVWEGFGQYLGSLAEQYDRAYATAFATRQQHLAEADAQAQRAAETGPNG